MTPIADGWKETPASAFFRRIGPFYARRRADNGWEYGMQTTEEHLNNAGAIHGGVLATFADQAFSFVAWEAAGRRALATVSLDLHFAAGAKPGDFLTAQARVVRAGASLIFLTGVLSSPEREVAIVSGAWSVVRTPANPPRE